MKDQGPKSNNPEGRSIRYWFLLLSANCQLPSSRRGFTLIEMMVAVSLFTIVMLISMTTLVSIINADIKAQSLQSIIDNLNFALDDMSRTVRTGTTYHCTDGQSDTFPLMGDPTVTQDCPGPYGSSYLSVEGSNGNRTDPNDQIVYRFAVAADCGSGFTGSCLMKSTQSGAVGSFSPITSPEISIDSARFYVRGSCPLTGGSCSDAIQPRAIVIISAHVTLPHGGTTVLNLQTTMTQRAYDI